MVKYKQRDLRGIIDDTDDWFYFYSVFPSFNNIRCVHPSQRLITETDKTLSIIYEKGEHWQRDVCWSPFHGSRFVSHIQYYFWPKDLVGDAKTMQNVLLFCQVTQWSAALRWCLRITFAMLQQCIVAMVWGGATITLSLLHIPWTGSIVRIPLSASTYEWVTNLIGVCFVLFRCVFLHFLVETQSLKDLLRVVLHVK